MAMLVPGRVYLSKKNIRKSTINQLNYINQLRTHPRKKKKHIRTPPFHQTNSTSRFRDTNGFAAFEGEIHQVGFQLDILMAKHHWVSSEVKVGVYLPLFTRFL